MNSFKGLKGMVSDEKGLLKLIDFNERKTSEGSGWALAIK